MKNKRNMMRNTFSLICLLLLAFSVSAQDETGTEATVKKMQFGIKVGTTLSSFSSEQPHNNFKPGLIAGGFVSYKLSGSLALQLEPSYMQQGGNLISILDYPLFLVQDPPFLLEIRDQKVTFHNIDIPLLLKFEKSIWGLNVFAVTGPTIGINFNAETKNSVSARSFDNIPVYFHFYQEENITGNMELLQYGAVGGIGFETPVGKHTLIFDMKYRYSLNKTYPGYSYLGIYQIQGDLRTNSFYITLGFGF
jgi:hypothetical protein